MKKPVRIIAVSDNHGIQEPIDRIREAYLHRADYFFHLGDSELPKYLLDGFACVRGNNDWYGDLPNDRILEIGDHRILLTHGHRDIYWHDVSPLAKRAAAIGCDIAFYGHTHVYNDTTVNGVRLLNPGSVWRNRDGSKPTYMIITLRGEQVEAVRMEYADLK